MVTLRRDKAVVANNQVFDKEHTQESMTDYDLFMEKKRQQKNEKYYSQSSVIDNSVLDEQSLSWNTTSTTDNITTNIDEEYDKYLLEQLNRSEPKPILSKEEFASLKSVPTQIVATVEKKHDYSNSEVKTIKTKSNKILSRNAKIFIMIYVIVVVIVASIILAVNSDLLASSEVDASASESDEKFIVSMNYEDDAEEEPTNAFDRFLDELTNR